MKKQKNCSKTCRKKTKTRYLEQAGNQWSTTVDGEHMLHNILLNSQSQSGR